MPAEPPPAQDAGDRHARLLALLDLAVVGPDHFRAPTPAGGPPRLFGGQVASQALRATTRTVGGDRRVHSLHSYFIRPGRPGVALDLFVERTRDGRSFSTRRVTAVQDGAAIFVLDASFHVDEAGDDWQETFDVHAVPGPDDLAGGWGPMTSFRSTNPFDVRPVTTGRMFPLHPCWVRIPGLAADDPGLHASALTFVSDLAVIGSARAPGSTAGWGGASLDHSVWFHRPVRVDRWLLFSVEPVTNAGARGLARGSFHDERGVLVASIAQECLLRPSGVPMPDRPDEAVPD